MSAHTPGPWDILRIGDVRHITAWNGRATIGRLHDYIGAEADARLIAAAPELLAALRYVLDCAERDDFSDLQPVRDAIEQAVQS